jgi:adenylate kinase family enzyme
MRRVSVVGNAGSGKSTVARALAARLGVPWVELDAIYHQAGWRPLAPEEFRARVTAAIATDGWVVDGNYSAVRELVWARADTVVWLDPPRRTVMGRIIWRTLKRAAFGTRLWNDNREGWRNLFTTDPDSSVVAWAWHQHATYRQRYATATGAAGWAHLRFIRIRSRSDLRHLLLRAAPVTAPPAHPRPGGRYTSGRGTDQGGCPPGGDPQGDLP